RLRLVGVEAGAEWHRLLLELGTSPVDRVEELWARIGVLANPVGQDREVVVVAQAIGQLVPLASPRSPPPSIPGGQSWRSSVWWYQRSFTRLRHSWSASTVASACTALKSRR